MRTLVVVPCGAKKIWADQPLLGAVRAAAAYVGVPFRVNRAYAEVVGDAWVILSAKYGFLAPDDLLDGPYEVTFKRKKTNPVAVETLRRQVIERDLASFDRVIGLAGVEYGPPQATARKVTLVWQCTLKTSPGRRGRGCLGLAKVASRQRPRRRAPRSDKDGWHVSFPFLS